MNKYLKISLIVVCVLAAGFLVWQIVIIVNKNNNPTLPPSTKSEIFDQTDSDISQSQNTTADNSGSEKIIIDKIGITAPIINNVDGNNMQAYLTALEGGVAHLAKTALPGESGNSVIFGHSSYYKAKPGNYKTIFAKLNLLASGDTIKVTRENKNYSYKISETKIVKPEDISVVSQDKSKKQLTLITCWPPKTTTSRMVIVANLE
ncbi:MAG: sortase [Candidatus Berkelbacteria bacterium]